MDAIATARHQRAIQSARSAREAAVRAYDEAICAAHVSGAPKTHIAHWAGTTRPTIDRILGARKRPVPEGRS